VRDEKTGLERNPLLWADHPGYRLELSAFRPHRRQHLQTGKIENRQQRSAI
jgi:hypothetical protein